MLMHTDLPYRLMKGKRIDAERDMHMSLLRVRRGGIGAFAAALFVDGKHQKQGAVAYCRQATRKIDDMLKNHQTELAPALRVEDFENNWRAGRTSVLRTIEGSWCFQGKADTIDEYYATGVRMIGLTWQGDHDFATSWTDSSATGLTAAGRMALDRMNRLGIAVDVSHMSDRAIDDVLASARAPVFASHSNARSVCGHLRNLTDDHLRRIAASGGIIGINLYPLHLRTDGNATVDDVVAHVRYIRDLVGVGAIGLGSDFDGIDRGPKGLETPADLPVLRRALRDAGFSDADIAAMFGGNFLRAMRQVEQRAHALSTPPDPR
jgi:membrane dipeptidase